MTNVVTRFISRGVISGTGQYLSGMDGCLPLVGNRFTIPIRRAWYFLPAP